MPRRRIKEESPSPPPIAPGIQGREFLAYLRTIFQEGADKGHFNNPADYNMFKAPIVTYMVDSSATGRIARAHTTTSVRFADGSSPRATLPYLPSGFKINESKRRSLVKVRKWETFVDIVEEVMNPDIKKARDKERALEKRRRKEERIAEAAAAATAMDDEEDAGTASPHSQKHQNEENEESAVNCTSDVPPEGYSITDSQLARMAEGGLENYGCSAIRPQQKVCASTSSPKHAAKDTSHGCKPASSGHRRMYTVSDPAAPSEAGADSEGESSSERTQEGTDTDLLPEDDPLLFTLECLAADIAHLPADEWTKSRRRLVRLWRGNTTKDLSFEALLGSVAQIVMLPVELEALARQQWERLEAAVRISARAAEVIAGDKESAEGWIQQKSRDLAWWRAGLGTQEQGNGT